MIAFFFAIEAERSTNDFPRPPTLELNFPVIESNGPDAATAPVKPMIDPLSNVLASIRYTKSRYGNLLSGWRGVGYENGGFITTDGLYRAGEKNKPEIVIPLTQKTRAIELMGQALAFLSGNEQKTAKNVNNSLNTNKLEDKLDSVISLLQSLLEKDDGVYMDGRSVESRIDKIRKREERSQKRKVGIVT